MGPETRFAADAMLGKLATWLRLLGCDVEYSPRISDDDLVKRASRAGRVLLTRDTRLVRRRDARDLCFFVQGDGWRDQLRQVARRYSLVPSSRILTRCVRCNEPLSGVGREAVRDRVPPYVFETQRDFRACGRCGRIYWPGTHHDRALAHLAEIFAEP